MHVIRARYVAHDLHVIRARYVAHDLYANVPWPLESTCWRQLAGQWGDCGNLWLCFQCDCYYFYYYCYYFHVSFSVCSGRCSDLSGHNTHCLHQAGCKALQECWREVRRSSVFSLLGQGVGDGVRSGWRGEGRGLKGVKEGIRGTYIHFFIVCLFSTGCVCVFVCVCVCIR